MGQNVSVDTNPPSINEMKAPSKQPKSSYSSNIKIWCSNGTTVEPAKFANLKTFSDKNCYIVLHLFRKMVTNTDRLKAPIASDKPSLYELARSTLESLSPRGTNYPFTVNEFMKEETFTLYLWHGKKSTSASQTNAIATCFEIEKHLDNSEKLFDCGEPEPITKWYKDDFYDASTFYSPDAFDYLCQNNSLARFFKNKYIHQNVTPSLGVLMKDQTKSRKFFDSNKENRGTTQVVPGSPSSISQMRRMNSFTMSGKKRMSEDVGSHQKSPPGTSTTRPRRLSMVEDPLPSPHRKLLERNPTLVIQKLPTTRSSQGSIDDDAKSPRPNPSWGAAEMVVYYRKICSEIRPYFFLGSDYIARSKDILKKHGITHIVNAARVACDNYFPQDFTYLSLNLYDSPSQNIIGLFFQVIDFIESALSKKQGVYVHCYQGVSRSTAIVVSYLMWKERATFRITNEDVKERRQVAAPNAGFTVQLIRWEKIIMQKSTETYMYRLSPLNDRYQEHRQTGPQLCDVAKLDTRTCFILYTAEGQMFIWRGKKATDNIEKDAIDFARLLEKSLKGLKETIAFVKEGDETIEFNEAFAKVVTPDAMKKQINFNNPYPELDDFDKEPQKNVAPIYKIEPIIEKVREKVEEDGKLYLFDGRSFENLTTFDSDDLDDDEIYVLESIKDAKLYVWVGADVEDADYKAVSSEFMKLFKRGENYEILETTRDEEGEDFWKYFVNG
jgi:hypothetical protein